MLLHLRELLSPDELQRARTALAHASWEDGRATAGAQAAQVKRNQQLSAGDPAAQPLAQLVLTALDRHALFFSAALPQRVLPPRFNRYARQANSYGNHVDQAIRHVSGGREALRTDLSCTVFLSEPDAYDGGELVIEHGFGQQRAKLAAGDALLYPGTSVHRVEPVTRGERLAAFFWVQSLVRSSEQRRLLFDMDMALVRLRAQHGDSAEAVALTGTYHNLLRLWATP